MCTAGQRVLLTITGPGPSFFFCTIVNLSVWPLVCLWLERIFDRSVMFSYSSSPVSSHSQPTLPLPLPLPLSLPPSVPLLLHHHLTPPPPSSSLSRPQTVPFHVKKTGGRSLIRFSLVEVSLKITISVWQTSLASFIFLSCRRKNRGSKRKKKEKKKNRNNHSVIFFRDWRLQRYFTLIPLLF